MPYISDMKVFDDKEKVCMVKLTFCVPSCTKLVFVGLVSCLSMQM